MVEVLLATGIRVSELVALKAGDVDLAGRRIAVRVNKRDAILAIHPLGLDSAQHLPVTGRAC